MKIIEKKYVLRFLLLLAATIIIFIFLFSNISFEGVLDSIESVDLRIICLTLLISIIGNIFIPAYRWRIILRKMKCKVSFRDCLFIKLSNKPLLKILPFRTGEFFKIVYLKHLYKIPYSKGVASIAVEYFLNFIILIVLMSIGGLIYLYKSYITVGLGAFISTTSLCFLLPICKGKTFRLKFFSKFINKFSRVSMKRSKNVRMILQDHKILFCTVSLSLAELVNVYLLSKTIGILFPLWAILGFMPIVIFAGLFKLSFGGMGVREWLITVLFFHFASPEKLLALGILYSFIEHIIPVLMGGLLSGVFLKEALYHIKKR